jgi:hypothetical protein
MVPARRMKWIGRMVMACCVAAGVAGGAGSAPEARTETAHKRTAAAPAGTGDVLVDVYTPISVVVAPGAGGFKTHREVAKIGPVKPGESLTVRVYLQKGSVPSGANNDISLEYDRDDMFGKGSGVNHGVHHFYYFHSDFRKANGDIWQNYEILKFPAPMKVPDENLWYSDIKLTFRNLASHRGSQLKFIASNKSIDDYAMGTIKVAHAYNTWTSANREHVIKPNITPKGQKADKPRK